MKVYLSKINESWIIDKLIMSGMSTLEIFLQKKLRMQI